VALEWTAGDLFAAKDLPALAHGCNCAGSMGAGIAVEFRRRWPDMYAAYTQLCKDGRFQPGDVFVWEAPERTIFNLGTQKTWRKKATLAAVEKSLIRLVEIADEKNISRVGLPRIGAGYGKLDWAKVRGILERVGAPAAVTLVVFEAFVPSKDNAKPRPI
jgi:O-acetyl-ADP-ribose deacetylase (regulator of RNase III)